MDDLQIFAHFFRRLYQFPAVKITAGIILWLFKLFFGAVCRPVYGIVILLWFLDTVTGYYHAWSNPLVTPESRRMYHGLVKLFIYYGLLALAYQISRYGADVTDLIRTTVEMAIILTESKSILENFEKIAKLKRVEIPFLPPILRLIQGKIDGQLQAARDAVPGRLPNQSMKSEVRSVKSFRLQTSNFKLPLSHPGSEVEGQNQEGSSSGGQGRTVAGGGERNDSDHGKTA